MDVSTILTGIQTTANILGQVMSKRGTKVEKKIDAVSCMQKAINATEIYLAENDHNYEPNENLSNLWVEAFRAMIPVNKEMASKLRHKSRFWANPHRWLEEDGALELIPDLSELNDTCERMLVELERRR